MVRNIALFLFLLVPSMAMAQLDSEFLFNGQNAESLKAQKEISIVIPEQVEVPSTCSRQVAVGEEQVCRNETRTRQECSWIPSSQRCWNDTDRVCRPVSRTRQQCSNGPSRRVCTNRPSRRVCTERPTRRVCRTRPDGRQHCTTVGGGQSCREVGGGQSCREVPGQRTCRTVSYTDQVCENVSRRRCETVPGRNDCRNVSYPERVCQMETQYRTETYACTRTETINRTVTKVLKNDIEVHILTNGIVEEFPVKISVSEVSPDFKAFNIDVKLLKEPEVFVLLNNKIVKVVEENEKEIRLESKVYLEVLSQEMLPMDFPASIFSASMDANSQKLTVVLEGALSSVGEVEVKLTHNPRFGGVRTVAELKDSYPSEKVVLGQVEDKAALVIDLKDDVRRNLKRNMKLSFKLLAEPSFFELLLNEKKPDTSKLYEDIFVVLK